MLIPETTASFSLRSFSIRTLWFRLGLDVGEGMVEHLSVFDYINFPSSRNSLVLATYLINVIRDVTDIKMATGS